MLVRSGPRQVRMRLYKGGFITAEVRAGDNIHSISQQQALSKFTCFCFFCLAGLCCVKNMDKKDFDFEKWCSEHELNVETFTALKEKGFQSELSLSVLCVEDIRKEFKKLTTQTLLLERAMRNFHVRRDTAAGYHVVDRQEETHKDTPHVPPVILRLPVSYTCASF